MRVVLFLVLASIGIAAEKPGSLNGRIVDPSGAPVPYARVSLTERGNDVRRSTVTGVAGEYGFGVLPTGEYLLEAQSSGFGASEARTIRIETGAVLQIDLTLEIARVSTQVQVTASGIAQTVDEQAKAVDIIDAEELDRRAEYSIGEALRTVPGIRVVQLGGPGSFMRVLTRGLRATDTSFLVDGFRLRDAASPQGDATAFISDLLLANTDQIEVLRGSGSSLYGTHATGGVVNVITDQGGGRLRGDLTTEGGGLGLFRGTARFSGGAWRDRVRFTGGVTHLNVTRGVDGDDRARNTTGHGFVQLQLSPATILSGRVLIADTFLQLNDPPDATPGLPAGQIVRAVPNVTYTPAPNDPDQQRTGMQSSIMTALSHTWSPRASTRVSYSGVLTDRDNRDGPAGILYEPEFNNSNKFGGRIDTIQARTDFQFDRRHLLTGGYEFEREAFDNLSTDENPVAAARTNARLRIHQASHAGFAQAQGRYLDGRLQLLVSGRLQRFTLSQPSFSGGDALYRGVSLSTPPDARTGDISAAYLIPKTSTRFRAHAGTGYRAPALYERFGASFFYGSFSAYGDPALRPERVAAIDGGFDQYLANSRVRLSGTYFYTRIQEAIVFDFSGAIIPATDPYGRLGGYRNTSGGLARGVEFSTEVNPIRSLNVRGSYTYTDSLDRVSQYGNGLLRSPRISNHMFTATASQRIGRFIDVTFDLFAASRYLIPLSSRAFEFDGPVKADLAASWTKPLGDRRSVRFYGRVENVLNRTFYEEGFPTPRATAVGGIKWLF
jgi:outer membrane cobalamin receptor